MNTQLKLLEFSNAADFLGTSQSFLMAAEAENNMLLSSALTLARTTSGRTPNLSYYVAAGSDGTPLAAALNVDHRRLLLSTARSEAAYFLGTELAKRQTVIRAALGPTEAIEGLSSGYQIATPSAVPAMPLARHQEILQRLLPRETPPPANVETAPGIWRAAKTKDLRTLIHWSRQFVVETAHDESKAESDSVIHRYLEAKRLFVWEDRGLSAMAGYGGVTANGVRINMVYTDPGARTQGYARSLVQALSRKLLSTHRHQFCSLLVAKDNHAANRVYDRIGYQRGSSFMELRRPTDQASTPPENDPRARASSR